MRQHPIGTGPFKFVEFKPNEIIKVVRNPDYWKPGRPYLDGIEYPIIKDVSTRLLSFIAGNEDVYLGVTMPQLKDVKKRRCRRRSATSSSRTSPRNMLINRDAPPFDNPELRRAMSLTHRPQGVHRHHRRRAGRRSAASCSRRPTGCGACRPSDAATLPGYDPDIAKSRAEARKIMEKLGYGPEQAADGHDVDAQHRALSRSGGDPDRPAEGDLHRRRCSTRSTRRNGIRR